MTSRLRGQAVHFVAKGRFCTLALLLLALLLGSCASVPAPPSGAECVAIGPRGHICLLPPAQWPPVQARHLVTITRDGQQQSFLGRLQIDAERLQLAGASLFGTHLFSIRWNGEAVTSEPADNTLHPRMLVAMLQLALVDPDSLRPQLYGLELKVRTHGGAEERQLLEHGHRVAQITIHGQQADRATFDIRVPAAKLKLHIEPLGSP